MKGALLLLATVAAGGCQTNDLSMAITQMEAVSKPSCVAMPSTGSGTVGLSRGLLDVALVTGTGYVGVPVVRNQMLSHMVGMGTELNSLEVTGANVTLKVPSGAAAPLPSSMQAFFYNAAGGRIDPAQSTPLFIEVIPAAAAQMLASRIPSGGRFTVVATIKPVAYRANDQVIGGPIEFPIDLCQNCLLINAGACPLPKGTVPATGGCFPQQDEPITCCTNSMGAAQCGAAAPIAM